jgi:phosphate transport system substrate-binding protein
VRALSLSKDGLTFFEPTPENVYAGKYPLSRFLYVYVNKAPNQPLNPTVREFLRFVLSKSGQEVVVKDGYLPLTGPMAERSLKAIGVGAGTN